MCVDLHTHSVYSDGTATPQELVRMAAKLKLHALALTDHDTLEGCTEAITAGKEHGVLVIPGMEISCEHGPFSLHILGYGVKQDDPALLDKLAQIQDGRRNRNRNILAKLAQLGIEISDKELKQHSPCGLTGRPHIAQILVNRKAVSTMNQAFRHYLGKDKPAYAKRFCFTAAESIDFIHEAGGAAVLAHPGKLDSAVRVLPRLIHELAERKLDGLEIYYPTHSGKAVKVLHKLAERFDLIATGGSDYHGNIRKNNGLAGSVDNICPPDSIIEKLMERIERNR
jgi:predicted metal-dependent phosphoesterase TrpH